LRKGVITEENFVALMILYSKIGGHVLTPFSDSVFGYALGVNKVKIGRWGDGDQSTGELPMEVGADGRTTEYD